MSLRRVAITGLGVVSPYGGTVDAFFGHMLAGRSAVQLLQTEDKPRPLRMPFVTCHAFDPAESLGKPLAGMMERFAHLGVSAAFGAWQDAGLPREAADPVERENWACVWGTALGGVLAFEKGYRDFWQNGRDRLSPLAVVMGMNNAVNAQKGICATL